MTPFLSTAHAQIEEMLSTLLPIPTGQPHAPLFIAARYSLLSGGKRLRPLLTLAATHDLGGDVQAALIPACALELVHTYSLIHDDLPSMDDDDMRRGKPSLHKAFNEGLAILTGDFLFTNAFELLGAAPHLGTEQKLQLIQTISSAAGSEGMIGGQVVDIAQKGEACPAKLKEWIDEKKTAALFMASLECGGIVAQATQEDQKALRTIGGEFGMVFQLFDDIADHSPSVNLKALKSRKERIFESLASLSKPPLELKSLITNFYEHVKTPL